MIVFLSTFLANMRNISKLKAKSLFPFKAHNNFEVAKKRKKHQPLFSKFSQELDQTLGSQEDTKKVFKDKMSHFVSARYYSKTVF